MTVYQPPQDIYAPIKDPDAVLDYEIDWSEWLPDGDTIASSEWLIVPPGPTKSREKTTATLTGVWLAGGVHGTTYAMTNRIVTAAGRHEDRTIKVPVRNR